jgi:hypothetical protein
MKLFSSVAAAALLVAAPNSYGRQADLANVACEGCSPQQMEDAARAEVDVGGVVVFSVSTGDIRKFIITWDQTLIEAPIDQPLENYFVALVRFWNENGRSLEINYYVDTGAWVTDGRLLRTPAAPLGPAAARSEEVSPGTVYEALQSPARMDSVVNRLNASWEARAHVAFNTFDNSAPFKLLSVEAGQPVAVLNYPDGSKSRATYDVNLKSWKPIPGTGRDMHGNYVPEKREDFVKDGEPTVYEFPGGWTSDAYLDFSRYAFEFGIVSNFREGDTSMVCRNYTTEFGLEIICTGRR